MKKLLKQSAMCLLMFIVLTQSCVFSAPSKAKKNKVGFVSMTYETKDTFVIKSKLFYPAEKKAVYPVVVLLHSLGYSGDYWAGLVKKFVDSGAAVLVVDLRGHGQSIYDSNFRIRSWVYYSNKNFAKYPSDVTEILNYMAVNYKNLSTTKYAIVGADIGANTAILSAERLRNKPACLALISPTREFKGLYTPIAMTNLGSMPILTMASSRDTYSTKETWALKKFAQGQFDVKPYPAGGMGMLMLKVNPTMSSDIVNWVMPKIKI